MRRAAADALRRGWRPAPRPRRLSSKPEPDGPWPNPPDPQPAGPPPDPPSAAATVGAMGAGAAGAVAVAAVGVFAVFQMAGAVARGAGRGVDGERARGGQPPP